MAVAAPGVVVDCSVVSAVRVVTDTVVAVELTTHSDTDIIVEFMVEVTALDVDADKIPCLFTWPSSLSLIEVDTVFKPDGSSFPAEAATEVEGNGIAPAVAVTMAGVLLGVCIFVTAVLTEGVTGGGVASVVELPPRSFCAVRLRMFN